MQIVSFRAENIKRLSAVTITPSGSVVEITGRNGQGKTSVLDAIWWALDSNKVVQSMPVRDGAEAGFVQLDLGDYIVTKKFRVKEDGDPAITLTVQNRDGAKYGSPVELLKGFFGAFTFDPLSFAEARPADQVIALRALVPSFDFAEADKANRKDFDERTEVNRIVRSLQEQIAAISVPDDTPPDRVNLSALMGELEAAMDFNQQADRAEAHRRELERSLHRLEDAIGDRDARIADLLRQVEELRAGNVADASSVTQVRESLAGIVIPDRVDPEPIREKIATVESTNRNVEQRERRDALRKQLQERRTESDRLTAAIDGRKAAASKAVRGAKMPIDGLELTEDRVLLKGIPLDQASDAEQLRLSIAVAAAMSPKLRIARVRDGSKLDREAMAELTRYAAENDLQVWVETVESSRETAIVIEDGMVASMPEAAE